MGSVVLGVHVGADLFAGQRSSCSVMVDQNSDFLCTFTACFQQDTIWEFVGSVVGTDCLVTIRDVDMPLYPNLAFFCAAWVFYALYQ